MCTLAGCYLAVNHWLFFLHNNISDTDITINRKVLSKSINNNKKLKNHVSQFKKKSLLLIIKVALFSQSPFCFVFTQ